MVSWRQVREEYSNAWVRNGNAVSFSLAGYEVHVWRRGG